MDIPRVTGALVFAPLLLAAGVSLGVLPEQSLIFMPTRIASGEIWRIVTGIVYGGKFESALLVPLYATFEYSRPLELHYGSQRYAWRLLFIAAAASLAAAYFDAHHPLHYIMAAVSYVCVHLELVPGQFRMGEALRISEEVCLVYDVVLRVVLSPKREFYAQLLTLLMVHGIVVLEEVLPRLSVS